MHAKTDSEVTSLALSSPPRSPQPRQIYYVNSPAHPLDEASTPGAGGGGATPIHHHRYMIGGGGVGGSSPIYHSRESTTTRFSASSLKPSSSHWPRKLNDFGRLRVPSNVNDDGEDDDYDYDDGGKSVRCYVVMFVLGFIILFSLFSLILWGASKSYHPEIYIKGVVFEGYNVQAGMDQTGVATKMLTVNSTVKIFFRNPATFFGMHVSSTPLQLNYYQLTVGSGQTPEQGKGEISPEVYMGSILPLLCSEVWTPEIALMKEFYQSRKSGRIVTVVVSGTEVPLYGAGATLTSGANGGSPAIVPVELSFVVRARARVLGKLVRSKFNRHVGCSLVLRENHLGKPVHNLAKSCRYQR